MSTIKIPTYKCIRWFCNRQTYLNLPHHYCEKHGGKTKELN